MMTWLRGFGPFLRNHWHHTLVVVLVVLVFFAGPVSALYDRVAAAAKFLPARR